MKDKDIEKYVEEYYNSKGSASKTQNNESDIMKTSLDNMDILNDMHFTPKVDFMEIINAGEEITNKKKDILEFFVFILSAFMVLLTFSAACILFGSSLFLYVEIFIAVILPFALIPLSYLRTAKEEY